MPDVLGLVVPDDEPTAPNVPDEPTPGVPAPPTTAEPVPPARPITEEDVMSFSSLPAVDVPQDALNTVIEDPKKRKRAYSTWLLIGMILGGLLAALGGGAAALLTAQQLGWIPIAAVGFMLLGAILGAYVYLTPFFAVLARSNVSAPKP